MLKQPSSVLVVSGDTMSRIGLIRALARPALPVAAATGWDDCESWLQRIPVSVIVTDVEELGRQELATLRLLRHEFPHISVIALVSLVTPEARAAAAEGLVAVVLKKPVLLPDLEEAVNSTLLGKASSCEV